MSLHLTIQIAAALTLLWGAVAITAHTCRGILVHQFIPAVLAACLGFFSLAEIMGWPV